MIIYQVIDEGLNSFLTFSGNPGTEKEGYRRSYKKSSIKEVITNEDDRFLTLVSIDNNTSSYDYKECYATAGNEPDGQYQDIDSFRRDIIEILSS